MALYLPLSIYLTSDSGEIILTYGKPLCKAKYEAKAVLPQPDSPSNNTLNKLIEDEFLICSNNEEILELRIS